jgi:hypothetical protein
MTSSEELGASVKQVAEAEFDFLSYQQKLIQSVYGFGNDQDYGETSLVVPLVGVGSGLILLQSVHRGCPEQPATLGLWTDWVKSESRTQLRYFGS